MLTFLHRPGKKLHLFTTVLFSNSYSKTKYVLKFFEHHAKIKGNINDYKRRIFFKIGIREG